METQKRRRGDRRDAALLRETDALHFIMGIISPNAPSRARPCGNFRRAGRE